MASDEWLKAAEGKHIPLWICHVNAYSEPAMAHTSSAHTPAIVLAVCLNQ